MTQEEDDDDGGQQGSHGVVSPVVCGESVVDRVLSINTHCY